MFFPLLITDAMPMMNIPRSLRARSNNKQINKLLMVVKFCKWKPHNACIALERKRDIDRRSLWAGLAG